jgi:hypothetical protein
MTTYLIRIDIESTVSERMKGGKRVLVGRRAA